MRSNFARQTDKFFDTIYGGGGGDEFFLQVEFATSLLASLAEDNITHKPLSATPCNDIIACLFLKVEEAKMEFRRQKLEQWRHRTKNATLTPEEFRAQKSKERRVKQVKGGSLMLTL